ncbi:hypothetical protein HOLleu_23261 [Holothuria leucospilota]|uniref:Sushi domain-containing protein n=1 Tax=Holothuria leucospilota TaxID=206669 RepID=A0A9Q1H4L3_HOLLE|nr:hypothetical protein HOLleu_23261 [Holothuria leucospilota]
MAHFECLDGYRLKGSEVIHCDIWTKEWDGPTYPICLAKTDDEDGNVGSALMRKFPKILSSIDKQRVQRDKEAPVIS